MEEELVALLKTNDEKALKKLFDYYHTPLCVLANTIVRDKDQAKDIVQDVFIKLWKNRHRLEITGSLGAYLRKATVNTALNVIESVSRSHTQSIGQTDPGFHAITTADQEVAYEELKQKTEQAIARLPIRTRSVFTLIRSEEMSYKEVSATLNISLKAVEKEMIKALKILREALQEYLPSAIIPLLAGIFY